MAKVHIRDIKELNDWLKKPLPPSDWQIVEQERITQFAIATKDLQWIHVDEERAAKESPFGKTIAHGFFTLSLLSGMIEEIVKVDSATMGVNYGLNKARFINPVRCGGRLRLNTVIEKLEPYGDNGVKIFWNCTIEIEHEDKPALVAEFLTILYE